MNPVEAHDVVVGKSASPPDEKDQAMSVCEDGEGSMIVGDWVTAVCEKMGPGLVKG